MAARCWRSWGRTSISPSRTAPRTTGWCAAGGAFGSAAVRRAPHYIGIESAAPAIPGVAPPVKALCVAPFGMEEGTRVTVREAELGLVVGESAEFRFFARATAPTTRRACWSTWRRPSLDELGPVETLLPAGAGNAPGEVVPVTLALALTAVGTLELYCQGRGRSGALEARVPLRERRRRGTEPRRRNRAMRAAAPAGAGPQRR